MFAKVDNRLNSLENIIHFVKSKKEPYGDEAVYLSETKRVELSFEAIQDKTIGFLGKLAKK